MDDITSSGDDHYAGSSRYNQRVPARVVNLTSTLQVFRISITGLLFNNYYDLFLNYFPCFKMRWVKHF